MDIPSEMTASRRAALRIISTSKSGRRSSSSFSAVYEDLGYEWRLLSGMMACWIIGLRSAQAQASIVIVALYAKDFTSQAAVFRDYNIHASAK